nr:hypothetical protein [uncultured Desulfobulbus sp.]
MASKKSNIEIILSARDLNLSTVITKGRTAIKAFTDQAGSGAGQIESMRSQVLQLAGAFAGLSAISDVAGMLQEADKNAYGLSASIQAANREFQVGSAAEWEQTISELSEKLKVYSKSDIKGAAAATIDMTKRLGLNADQMQRVLELSGDLAVGRTDLAGAVERVTSALRGEAEASEYLGLTLNETYVQGWYEAHGAMQGAWKDLNDLQKAQVRYNVFLEQALPLQGKAAESINTYAGAIQYIRTVVADNISTNAELLDALKQVGEVLRENAGEIGSFVGDMASAAAGVIEFVADNRELLLVIGEYGIKFGLASAAIGKLIAVSKGVNAAFTTLVGTGIVPWLQAIESGSTAAVAGLTGVKMGFIGLMGAVAAFYAAYKLGEWLTMGKEMRELSAAQNELERATKKVNREFATISKSTGVTITSMEELDQAVANGKIHYDELSKSWVKGAKEQQQATEQAASSMKKATGDALDEMKKKYQEYAKEIRRIQGDIYGRERSLASELREMSRSGMSDYSAWNDRKKEAEEYAAAAKQAAQEAQSAMASGDTITASEKWKEAVQYADDAKSAYKDLNKEVKDGDQVVVSQQQALKTAMAGVKEAGELGIDILKQQQQASKAAMDQLKSDSGFADLTEGMDKAEKTWLGNWENMKDFAGKQILWVEERIDAMVKDRHVTVYVTEKVQKATGGTVGYARGGKLPGYGGGDRISALLEAGEFIIRKEAVSRYGSGLFHALNNLNLPDPQKFAVGGQVGFAAGGQASSVNLPDFGTLRLVAPNGTTAQGVVNKQMALQLIRIFEQIGFRMNA